MNLSAENLPLVLIELNPPLEALPVQNSTQGPTEQSDWQAWRKAKHQHAYACPCETRQKNWLSPYPVAQFAPDNTCGEFGKRESGCNHAGVHCDLAILRGDIERLDHVIDVGENGHECDRLAYSTKC